jgi:hypothetical protein
VGVRQPEDPRQQRGDDHVDAADRNG